MINDVLLQATLPKRERKNNNNSQVMLWLLSALITKWLHISDSFSIYVICCFYSYMTNHLSFSVFFFPPAYVHHLSFPHWNALLLPWKSLSLLNQLVVLTFRRRQIIFSQFLKVHLQVFLLLVANWFQLTFSATCWMHFCLSDFNLNCFPGHFSALHSPSINPN